MPGLNNKQDTLAAPGVIIGTVAIDQTTPGTTNNIGNTPTVAAAWTTLINAVRLDDDPTYYYSAALDVEDYDAVWVLIFIDSTLAPTNVRILAQFSDDAGTTWWDFEEGFWAALYWEDVDTASGVKKALLLPCTGIDTLRIGAIATGTDATNYFDVTVKCRQVRGNVVVAHA